MLVQLGADIVYAGLTATGAYSAGLIDLGWMTSYLCRGAVARHPPVRSLSRSPPGPRRAGHQGPPAPPGTGGP